MRQIKDRCAVEAWVKHSSFLEILGKLISLKSTWNGRAQDDLGDSIISFIIFATAIK